jgi:hypothetical protein
MQMATTKPEVLIYQQRNEVSEKFQRVELCFRQCPNQQNYSWEYPMSTDTQNAKDDRQTGSTYISGTEWGIWKIPKLKPRFRQWPNQVNYSWEYPMSTDIQNAKEDRQTGSTYIAAPE